MLGAKDEAPGPMKLESDVDAVEAEVDAVEREAVDTEAAEREEIEESDEDGVTAPSVGDDTFLRVIFYPDY